MIAHSKFLHSVWTHLPKGEMTMKSKFILVASILLVLGVMNQPQAQAQEAEQNRPGPSGAAYTKSDLEVYVNAVGDWPGKGQINVSGSVRNIGPVDYQGTRMLTLSATTDGKTTVIKKVKIPALEVNKPVGGFSIDGLAPSNANDKTVYKASISGSPGDPNSKNDSASRTGAQYGKP
jgi:hypothetical protein